MARNFLSTQLNCSFTAILSQDLINKADKWQFPKNALDWKKFHTSLKPNQLPLWLLMCFSHDDIGHIGMTAGERFLSRLGHPDRPKTKQNNKKPLTFLPTPFSLIFLSLICFACILKYHIRTKCASALYRLTVTDLPERGRWEKNKTFYGKGPICAANTTCIDEEWARHSWWKLGPFFNK